MIRLGVLSDTHRQMGEARKALQQMGKIDYLLHGGDHFDDAQDLLGVAGVPVEAVVGNCDWWTRNAPNELLLKYGGVRLLLIHGHQHRVRFGYEVLVERALELKAQVAVFGHTHVPVQLEQDGVLLFNPGSVATPRGGTRPSFGILTIKDGEVYGEIIPLKE